MAPKSHLLYSIVWCSACASLLLPGCARNNAAEERTYPMGEKAQAGKLIYTVLEAEWKSQLGELPSVRVPKHRYLILRITVTNSGSDAGEMPLLSLVDGRGQTYQEEASGDGVPEWLGLLRKIQPAGTEEGRIVFDVPMSAYKLRITDGAQTGEEKTALVSIPLQLDEPGAVPTPSTRM
jgi:hypothetical protein